MKLILVFWDKKLSLRKTTGLISECKNCQAYGHTDILQIYTDKRVVSYYIGDQDVINVHHLTAVCKIKKVNKAKCAPSKLSRLYRR